MVFVVVVVVFVEHLIDLIMRQPYHIVLWSAWPGSVARGLVLVYYCKQGVRLLVWRSRDFAVDYNSRFLDSFMRICTTCIGIWVNCCSKNLNPIPEISMAETERWMIFLQNSSSESIFFVTEALTPRASDHLSVVYLQIRKTSFRFGEDLQQSKYHGFGSSSLVLRRLAVLSLATGISVS